MSPAAPALFRFEHTFADALPEMHLPARPAPPRQARLLCLNGTLAGALGLDAARLASEEGLGVLSGAALPEGLTPIAQAYAGHQFGHYSPRLGDGRALLLGEVRAPGGQRWDIALKGSGPTAFSRGGDGKAALGPVLREYLVSEAMHALGIPTTRSLAAVATGDVVLRHAALPGAVLTRVAASHLRIGSLSYAAATGGPELVSRLVAYALARHPPERDPREGALALLHAVAERHASLVARWMGVGFIHGVMNTDNMSLSGETLDYGPCAFLESYDPATVFSSIDQQGRYAFGNQPHMARWNLARLAESLLPLLHDDEDQALQLAHDVLDAFPDRFAAQRLATFRGKLGLDSARPEHSAEAARDDDALINDYLELMHEQRVDFTLGFRRLSAVLRGEGEAHAALFGAEAHDALARWRARWQARLGIPALPSAGPSDARGKPGEMASMAAGRSVAAELDRHNPLYIPRNHLVEAALASTHAEDPFAEVVLDDWERLRARVVRPFAEDPADDDLARPATARESAGYRTFCGT